jgi:SAM-dependent methyltransferase
MQPKIVEILRCPQTGDELRLEDAVFSDGRIKSGWLISEKGNRYPVKDFIPRFVPASNYADNFGMQWNKFPKTQLDSYSGLPISSERFWKSTEWKSAEIAGKWVLDAGCGAGRFAEVALKSGANVIALDYSSAVDACYANLKEYPNLTVVQGDIYALPFPKEFFSFVYSLGVLQHTPDVAKAFAALPPMLMPGGQLCVDFYEDTLRSKLMPKFWLRPITKRMSKPYLFSILEFWVPKLLPFSQSVGKIPLVGKRLKGLIPVANYTGLLPLSEKQLLEWSLLDTFDWLAPEYEYPQKAYTVKSWLIQAGLQDPQVSWPAHLVGKGRKA